MENIGLPKLTSEQIEQLCSIAEEAARKYVYSKIPTKAIGALNVSAEAEGTKPVKLTVDVDIALCSSRKDLDTKKLTDEAVEFAFEVAEKFLRDLACHSQK